MAVDKSVEKVWKGLTDEANGLIKAGDLDIILEDDAARNFISTKLRGLVGPNATAQEVFVKDTLLFSLYLANGNKKDSADAAKDYIDLYKLLEPTESARIDDKMIADYLEPLIGTIDSRLNPARPRIPITSNLTIQSAQDESQVRQAKALAEHVLYFVDHLSHTEPFSKYPKSAQNAAAVYEMVSRGFKGMTVNKEPLLLDSMDRIRSTYNVKYGIRPPANISVPSRIDEPALKEALAELNALEGLEGPKKDVNNLIGMIRNNRRRAESGLKTDPITLHMMYAGNPGTGKTTVARIIGKVYKALGVMGPDFKGNFNEVRAADLIAGYVGQTAPQTRKVIEKALGGVLFIDEAYSLVASSPGEVGGGGGKGSSFAQEAIAELVAQMENRRDNLVVILAGYPDEMETLLRSNPGLPSRIGTQITFEDYTPDRLLHIFKSMIKSGEYEIDEAGEKEVKRVIEEQYAKRDRFFGNGRLMRDIYEQSKKLQGARLNELEQTEKRIPTREEQIVLTLDDIRGIDLRKHVKAPEGSSLYNGETPSGFARGAAANANRPEPKKVRRVAGELAP